MVQDSEDMATSPTHRKRTYPFIQFYDPDVSSPKAASPPPQPAGWIPTLRLETPSGHSSEKNGREVVLGLVPQDAISCKVNGIPASIKVETGQNGDTANGGTGSKVDHAISGKETPVNLSEKEPPVICIPSVVKDSKGPSIASVKSHFLDGNIQHRESAQEASRPSPSSENGRAVFAKRLTGHPYANTATQTSSKSNIKVATSRPDRELKENSNFSHAQTVSESQPSVVHHQNGLKSDQPPTFPLQDRSKDSTACSYKTGPNTRTYIFSKDSITSTSNTASSPLTGHSTQATTNQTADQSQGQNIGPTHQSRERLAGPPGVATIPGLVVSTSGNTGLGQRPPPQPGGQRLPAGGGGQRPPPHPNEGGGQRSASLPSVGGAPPIYPIKREVQVAPASYWSSQPYNPPINRRSKQYNRGRKFNTRYPAPEKPRQKRAVIQDMVRPLKQWLLRHRHNPYPTKPEKLELAKGSNMTLVQVSNWFANARRRLKNVVQEPGFSWSKRLRLYNSYVQGNAEILSITSDDSIWNSEDEDELKRGGQPGHAYSRTDVTKHDSDLDEEEEEDEDEVDHLAAEQDPTRERQERRDSGATTDLDQTDSLLNADHSYSIPGCLTPPEEEMAASNSPVVSSPGEITPYVSPPSSPPTLTPQRSLSPSTPDQFVMRTGANDLSAGSLGGNGAGGSMVAGGDAAKYKTHMMYRYLQDAAKAQETFAEDSRKDEDNRLVIDEKSSRLGDFESESSEGEGSDLDREKEEEDERSGGGDQEDDARLSIRTRDVDVVIDGDDLVDDGEIQQHPQPLHLGQEDVAVGEQKLMESVRPRAPLKVESDVYYTTNASYSSSSTTSITTAPTSTLPPQFLLPLPDDTLGLLPAGLPAPSLPFPCALSSLPLPPVGAQEEVVSPQQEAVGGESVPVAQQEPNNITPTSLHLLLPQTQVSGYHVLDGVRLTGPPSFYLAGPPAHHPHILHPYQTVPPISILPVQTDTNCDIVGVRDVKMAVMTNLGLTGQNPPLPSSPSLPLPEHQSSVPASHPEPVRWSELDAAMVLSQMGQNHARQHRFTHFLLQTSLPANSHI